MILSGDLANHFIDKITSYSKFNINIMNEQGIIIAASIEKKRIGSFHEIAFHMIQEHTPIVRTEPGNHHYLGTKYGVNVLLQYGHEVIGVVGMTGLPSEVESLISMVKLALETMVEYESQHDFMQQRKDQQLRFMNNLLFSENEEDLSSLPTQADSLGYSERLYRIPILISFQPGENSALFTDFLHSSQSASKQDIILTPAENEILVYKSLPQELDRMLENYQYIIGDLLNPLLKYVREHDIQCKCYIGSIHKNFHDYRHGYRHCCWMRFFYRNSQKNSFYFYNCIEDYLTYQIPLTELENIFSMFLEKLPDEQKEHLTFLIPALDSHGYNLNKAAKELYIHKNTVVFQLNKLREYLSMDPVQNAQDRKLLYYLTYYLNRLQ